MKQFLTENYLKYSKADYYIIGYIFGGNVYYSKVTDIMPFLKLDKASRNAGYSLRLNITKAEKIQLLELNPSYLCKAKHFYKLVKNSKYNKGDIFEMLILKKYHKKWKKSNTPFYEKGDMRYKKQEIQIKFERATFTNEKQIKRLINGI